jgi:hypothetical protein
MRGVTVPHRAAALEAAARRIADTAMTGTASARTGDPNDWTVTAAGWTAGYDLTRSEERARFQSHVSRETDRSRLTVAQLCQIATQLGAANPPGTRAAAQRTLADILIIRSLVERRGAHLVAGRVITKVDGGEA